MEAVFFIPAHKFSVKASFKGFLNEFFAHIHYHFIPHQKNNYHPHILSHKMTALFTALLITVKIFSLSLLAFSPAIPAFSSAISEENIVALTNQTRLNYGLNELKFSSVLALAAQEKANDMAEKGYFAHTSPDGRLPWDFMKAQGYDYIMAGENLAVNFVEAETVSTAWMNSPTHKANIVNKNYEEIGIGIAQGIYGNKQSIFVVQMFGVPTEQTIVLKKEPTKVVIQSVPLPKTAESLKPIKNLSIDDVSVNVIGADVVIRANTSPNAVKVLAIYGQKAVRLTSVQDGVWQGLVPLKSFSDANQQLVITAYNLAGQKVEQTSASFSKGLTENYILGQIGKVAGKTVSAFGRNVNLGDFEHKFYLLFVAGILTCLILAIGIKRHIQHIGMVANGSFVAILAMLLWMG